jgi:FtsH-binding integral membrane protein
MADILTVPPELRGDAPQITPDTEAETQRFMQKVYGWMAFALVVSGATAWYVANDITLLKLIFESGLFTPLLLLEIGLVI